MYGGCDEGFLPQKEMELRIQGVKSAIDGIVQGGNVPFIDRHQHRRLLTQ